MQQRCKENQLESLLDPKSARKQGLPVYSKATALGYATGRICSEHASTCRKKLRSNRSINSGPCKLWRNGVNCHDSTWESQKLEARTHKLCAKQIETEAPAQHNCANLLISQGRLTPKAIFLLFRPHLRMEAAANEAGFAASAVAMEEERQWT